MLLLAVFREEVEDLTLLLEVAMMISTRPIWLLMNKPMGLCFGAAHHFPTNFFAFSGSHDGPMDSDSIGSAAAIQAMKMSAQQNEPVLHSLADASPKPLSAPIGNAPPSSPKPAAQEEEETDSATAAATPPSTGNPAQDKIVIATPPRPLSCIDDSV